jgi:hypothetical protein
MLNPLLSASLNTFPSCAEPSYPGKIYRIRISKSQVNTTFILSSWWRSLQAECSEAFTLTGNKLPSIAPSVLPKYGYIFGLSVIFPGA